MRENKDAFAFLKADDLQNLQEWEANQEELDRQWYDQEEGGNLVRY